MLSVPAQASSDTSLRFPPGLNNDDRAVVHAECRKARFCALTQRWLSPAALTRALAVQYGFTSKSHGKGDSRVVTVSKARSAAVQPPLVALTLVCVHSPAPSGQRTRWRRTSCRCVRRRWAL